MSTPSLYADHPSWRRYRALLRDRFAIDLPRPPDESWLDWQGHSIHLDTWQPDRRDPRQPGQAARGTVVLVHGAGGHGRLLAPLGHALADGGWRALAPDLPGYGLSVAPAGWRPDVADWSALVAWLANRTPGPVALVGVSVGGLTALRAAQQARGVRGVAVTTLIDPGDDETFRQIARARWLGSLSLAAFRQAPWLVDRLRLPLRLVTPIGLLTADPVLRRYFERDPLLGGRLVSGRFLRSLRAPLGDLALPCPLLLAHPGADAWTPTALSRRVFDRVPTAKRLVELTGGSHLPVEPAASRDLRSALAGFLGEVMGPERAGEGAAP